MLDLFFGASLAVKVVMIGLLVGSVSSWAIILFKIRELRSAEGDTEEFVEAYHERSTEATYDVARGLSSSPLAVLFIEGYRELSHLRKLTGGDREPTAQQVDNVVRRLNWTHLRETQRAERGLSFLASCGSTAPFIGLFGTVIGIMNSFEQIGASGSASLATVGPGIAEALLATAIGLFAAIPAVVAFNYLGARVGRLIEQFDAFRDDFEHSLRVSSQRAA